VYAKRAQYLLQALKSQLPPNTKYTGECGGYFLWVELPKPYDARAIIKLSINSENGGIIVGGGDLFEVPDVSQKVQNGLGWGERCMRLSYSWLEEDELQDGVDRLGTAIRIWESLNKTNSSVGN